MEHSMRDRILIIIGMLFATAIAAAQGNVTNQRVLAESASGENWFLKGGDFNGTHYSPLSQINEDNVDRRVRCRRVQRECVVDL
jgi:glucose dehydrogenase